MCDHAGFDALWVHDHLLGSSAAAPLSATSALEVLAAAVGRAQIGANLRLDHHTLDELVASIRPIARQLGRRLELSFSADSDERAITALRDDVRSFADTGPAISIEARTGDAASYRTAARIADDVVVVARSTDVERVPALIAEACAAEGRERATLGVAVEVPVSIGRTLAEAEARAHGDQLFSQVGQPSEIGVFGTLERCQQRVIELAHAGVTDLRCILPDNLDIHDVIAQLTSIAIGTVDVLVPGAPRSPDPEPPASWGGRRP